MTLDNTALIVNDTRPRQRVPFTERVTVTVADAMEMSGLSQSYLYLKLKSGELESTTVGRRRLIYVASLRRLLGIE